jgi:glucans biosynthesis protein C
MTLAGASVTSSVPTNVRNSAQVDTGSGKRLLYVDNLRLFVIICVVMHHLGVTYSGFGSWYYNEPRHLDLLSTIWFAFYLSFQQAYFMGLLFMIAGYFVARSYDRRGFGGFVGERYRRLAIPSLIYMIAIDPFILLVELRNKWAGLSLTGFLSATGVMWFAAALFIFSVIYALVRLIVRRGSLVSNGQQLRPTLANAIILILAIAVCAFLIRIVQPIGTSILNMQLCYFASYIILFIVGIIAYRMNLFDRISYQAGRRWLIGGVSLGFLSFLALFTVITEHGSLAAYDGGVTWESAAYSIWESSMAVAMSIGLIAVFREKLNHQNRLVKAMSDSSFTVYMFHPPIIVAVSLLFSPVTLLPIVKWLMLCAICVSLCFVIAHLILRRVPLLKAVL